MHKFIRVTLPLFLTLAACSGKDKTTPTGLLATALSPEYLQYEVLTVRPIAGHHFNLKAPNKCGGGQLLEGTTPMILKCQLTATGAQELLFSVCDDKETFCRQETRTVKVLQSGGKAEPRLLAAPTPPNKPAPGFLQNQPDQALTRAKANKQLLFIDFFGIWCPPCNLLEENVFGRKEFVSATQNIVKVQLDADAAVSYDWKARFKVSGYPTLVLADSELREIARIVGYRPLPSVLSWLKRHRDLPPVETLLTKKQLTPADNERLAEWLYERENYASLEKTFAANSSSKVQLLVMRAKLASAQAQRDKQAAKAALAALLKRYPDNVQFGSWALDYLGYAPDEAKKLMPAAFRSLEQWRRSPKLSEEDYTAADLWWIEAELRTELGEEAAAKKAYAGAAKEYEKLAKQSELALPRGANMDRAYALYKSGDLAASRALYEALLKEYGQEFTFNYNYGWLLHDLKEFDKALPLSEAALTYSYGDNYLRAAGLKAKVQEGMGKIPEAKSTLEEALEKAVAPAFSDVRTHGYIARLRTQLSDLNKKK